MDTTVEDKPEVKLDIQPLQRKDRASKAEPAEPEEATAD
jgi:ATP-dependent Clp protease ATP-binding subunit ClpA